MAMPQGQAKPRSIKLSCHHAYHLFDSTDGAGLRYQIGVTLQGNMIKLDWLEDVMPA